MKPIARATPLQRVISPTGRLKAEQEQLEACSSTDRLRVTVTIAGGGKRGGWVRQPATAFVGVRGEALGSMATGQRAAAADRCAGRATKHW